MTGQPHRTPSPPGRRGRDEGVVQPHEQILVYPTEDGRAKIEVRFENETVWLTEQQMADLFQTTQQNIRLQLQNIYAEGELQRESTRKEFLSVRQDGLRAVQCQAEFYNLDAVISVGYRVTSAVATRFRIWATQQLREFIVKGCVLGNDRQMAAKPTEAPRAKVRSLEPYYVIAGMGMLVTPAAWIASGSSRQNDPAWAPFSAWLLIAVTGVVCGVRIARLGPNSFARILGALLVAFHCGSLLLLQLVCSRG